MNKRNLIVAGVLAATLLAGVGLAASATDNPQAMAALGEARKTLDAALGDEVETLLRTDVGLAGSQLRVQARSGVVILGGSVPDEHSLRRAFDLASGVHGVREVRNAMEIAPPKF